MSKRQADIIDRLALVETDVKLEKYAPKQEDVLEYAEAKRNNQAIADSSLNDYLKQKYFPAEKNIVIVADLSGMKFDNGGKTAVDSYIDLRDVDFSGSIMKDTEFIGCDMTNAIFCDTDLGNASFNNTKLRNVDFRGADLADCKFDEGYSNVRGDQRKIFTDGIKYSMTSYLGRYYADIKADAVRMREKREAIESKQEELNQQYAKLSYVQAGWASTGLSSGDKEYDKIALELSEMRRGKFPEKEYIMNKSFQNIFGSTSQEFDPLYIRGSDQAQRSEKKKYVPLTRNDVEEYLKLVKSEPELSLNDFAKKKFIKEATAGEESISSITKFIADFSGQVDPITQKWVRPDLTNLEFEGTDLKEVNFSGADLSNCKFIKADISRSTFESALVTKSAFSGTIAKDVNFFNADLQNAEISESNFQRAFMPKSNAESAQISKTDFDYSNIRGGKWDQVSLEGSTFNFANLEGISLINADIRKVKMQHAILADVMMSGAQIIESEFTGSLMEGVTAIKTKWENSSLEGIIAKNIDLTEAELDSLCKLDNAQLEQAVMTRIKAERVSFIRANMDGIKAEQADLRGAILEDASLKFANLEKAILSEAKARKIDMTGANLTNAVAISANFLQAVMRDMDAQNINLESANISDADLAGSDLRKAMMAKVDARRANLENVGLQDADLHGAKVHGAKVNEATNNVGTNQKDVTGEFTGPNGEAITPKAQQEQQEIINKLKNTSSLSKIIGNALDTFATAAGKISELIRQPFSTKMGKYVGLIGGITLGVAIAAAIPTGGLSLVAVAAIGAGVVAGCAVGGAVTGHFAAKRCGLSTAITGVASAVIMGPAIAGISTMASVVLNKALATVTGKTIDEHAAGVIEGAANLAAGAAAGLGVRKESQELMEKHQSAVAGHVKATQLVDQNPGNQKLLFEEMKKRAALEEANSLLSKNQNLHDGIAAVKKSIAGFVGQLPIIKHGAPAVEVKERAKIDKVDAIQR